MSSPYSVLNNKPIDQWRVTELKEELRKRKLPIKGLKEDLVKRLDEAVRNEKESTKEEVDNGFDLAPDPQDNGDQVEEDPQAEVHIEAVTDKVEKTDNDATIVDGSPLDINQVVNIQDGDPMPLLRSDAAAVEPSVNAASMEDSAAASVGDSITESQHVTLHNDSSSQDLRYDERHEESKPSIEDVMRSPSEPKNQVSEVSPDLGFQVRCESISTDSVSIIEKNKLKDNLNDDNFHLEVVKPEMMQISSSNDPPICGDLHPLDDDKELVKNQVSLEEADAKNATNLDLSKNEDSADGGSPEKLNLDRSSGDESMEEDVLESKHIESNIKSDEPGEKTEASEMHTVEKGTSVVAAVGVSSLEKKDTVDEEKVGPTAPTEKRKLEDNEAVRINEAIKRQRRWNSESIKFPEQQSSNISTSSILKDALLPATKRTFTRSDSTLSGDSPKERVVPPSHKLPTTSLRIDHFLRPFTLKAVQELLAKTGTVCSFWMDQIKTHCYVTYSSVEEAVATRNAVYNLQWPPNGGKLLAAEFVDPQEVKQHVEAPPQSSAPISSSPVTPKASPFEQPQASQPSRQHTLRQQLPPPPTLPPPPPTSDPPVGERLPAPPPLKKPEQAVVTLDDFFKKTKASPRIYFLPLSEEQVMAKLAAQGKSIRG
ncbi:apoptotic chromatin condensation inducer in the nucleus-like [Phoenix dactylifera]|uniref:Apoptotic chromatin condensation inducer in the nucleus-like n=1 Tax=Phoenix dactylifera TaxID=42345 RepID=A0A8B7CFY8_PHODC|nr:apoptotic chromatin condensation inducer in the nucleus-like [Phoenix dactylifera]